jgi:hypothetical protein
MVPVLKEWVRYPIFRGKLMRLITTREASRLTGLSADQLREWTSRRALIPADVRPRGHGSPAKYRWHTILLLRVAGTMRDRFRVELQTHRQIFAEMRQALSRTSFLALWGKSVAIYGTRKWAIVDDGEPLPPTGDAIILRLAPHLQVLSVGFALPHPAVPGQLDLFPARGVAAPRKARADGDHARSQKVTAASVGRRRTA